MLACALAAPASAHAASDLVLTMTAAPDPVKIGDLLTYEVFVTNAGPDAADGVTVSDSLPGALEQISAETTQGSCAAGPAVTCSLGALASGQQATVTIQARPNDARTLVNSASVSASSPDPAQGNNSATVAVQVQNEPPVISSLSVTNRVFRVDRFGKATGAQRRALRGTAILFRLSEAATVTFRVERRTTGRRVGGKCRKQTRRNRGRRRCVRWVSAAQAFRRPGGEGANRVEFSGRVRTRRGVRALQPGAYRVRARALDADGGRSAERSTRFRVVRR